MKLYVHNLDSLIMSITRSLCFFNSYEVRTGYKLFIADKKYENMAEW